MISLVTIYHHTKLSQNCWLYSLQYKLYTHDLFYVWKFIPLNSLYLLCQSSHLCNTAITRLFSECMSLLLFYVCSLNLFLDSKCNHMVLIFALFYLTFHLAFYPLDYSHCCNSKISFLWLSSILLLSDWNELNWVFHCVYISVQFSHSVVSNSLQPHESQHARHPCLLPTSGVHSNSRPSSWWCHPAISSSVVSFSSCPQSLPGSVFSNESPLHEVAKVLEFQL